MNSQINVIFIDFFNIKMSFFMIFYFELGAFVFFYMNTFCYRLVQKIYIELSMTVIFKITNVATVIIKLNKTLIIF